MLVKPFFKTPICLGVTALFCSICYANTTPPLMTDQNYTTDTTLDFDGNAAVVANRGKSVTISVADGAELKIQQIVSESYGKANRAVATQGTVIQAEGGSIAFNGGNVLITKPDYYKDDAQGPTGDVMLQSFISSRMGSSNVVFNTKSIKFEGSVDMGVILQGQSNLTFANGVTMIVDRSECLSPVPVVYGTYAVLGGNIQVLNDSTFVLKAGAHDQNIRGASFSHGGSGKYAGRIKYDIDTTANPELENAFGLYVSKGDARATVDVKPFVSTGEMTLDLVGNEAGKTNLYAIYAAQDMEFNKLNISEKNAKQAIGVFVQDNNLTVKDFSFKGTETKSVWGIYATGGSVEIANAEIGARSLGASMGVRAGNNAQVTFLKSLTTDAADSIHADGTAQVDVRENFLAQDPTTVTAKNTSHVKINSTGLGVVRLSGNTQMDDGASLEMNLNTTQTDASYWNVLGKSKLSKLALGGNARLNFYIDDNSVINGSDSMIAVVGDSAVDLEPKENTGISLVSVGLDIHGNDTLGLISSAKGFTLDGGVINAGADLNAFKKDLQVTNVESLIRLSQSEIKSDQYDLLLESDNRLIAKIKAAAPKDTTINDQTDALMESSASVYATMFAVDDLFVDSILRTRNGSHRDGLFVAARAGKYDVDTRTKLDTNIISGLLGYALQNGGTEVGGFIEMGYSSYDTMTYSALGNVAGSGKHNYGGAGLYVDYATPVDGLKLTGYLKGGVLSNNFDARCVDQSLDFDRTSAYWGAHAGAHFDTQLAKLRSRFFLSYFYDGREGEGYHLKGSGDSSSIKFKYDSLNAHRVQVGGLFEYDYTPTLRPYFGLTLEEILSAKAKGTATDNVGTLQLNSSNMHGMTGIVSAGWNYVNPDDSFEFELGVGGYVGARQGVSGQVQASWKF